VLIDAVKFGGEGNLLSPQEDEVIKNNEVPHHFGGTVDAPSK
jgi:hypothetical protein